MKKKEISKEINAEYLKKVSIHGGLLSFFNAEEEAKALTRQLFFPDFNSKAALRYAALSDRNRNLIGRLASKLSKYRENRGFNLYLYLYWLTKSCKSSPQLTNALISKLLYMVYNELSGYDNVSIWLNKIQDRPNMHDDGDYFGYLKNNLLFSAELITKGVGYIDVVKPCVIDEYHNHFHIYKELGFVEDGSEDIKGISVRKKLEILAAYTERKWEELVDRTYCAINYTYSYAFLDESSRELVDELIKVLYEDNKGVEILTGLYQSIIDGTIKPDTDGE